MRLPGLLATITVLTLPGLLTAQRVDPTRIIRMHINAEEQNVSLTGSIPEGGRFRVFFAADRSMYAVSPALVRGETFTVSLLRGDGKPEDGDNQNWRLLETVSARLGRPVALRSLRKVTVVIDGTETAGAPAATGASVPVSLASYLPRPLSLSGECCVTCNGVGACGCRVVASCGSCCVPPCDCKVSPLRPSTMLLAPEQGATLAAFSPGRRCPPVPDDERLFTARAEPAVRGLRPSIGNGG
jgi:hypothetical protein